MVQLKRRAPAREVDTAAKRTGGPIAQIASRVFSLLVSFLDSF